MVLALCTLPLPVEARDTPTNATVLIRIRGTVRVAAGLWPGAPPEVTEFRDVEIGTGSGFVVSADGYIVTNHHAISDDTFEIERQGQKVRVSVDVQSHRSPVPIGRCRGIEPVAAIFRDRCRSRRNTRSGSVVCQRGGHAGRRSGRL